MRETEIERLYNTKIAKYTGKGIKVSNELAADLYIEAIRECASSNFINVRG